jgi:hypothetical protein
MALVTLSLTVAVTCVSLAQRECRRQLDGTSVSLPHCSRHWSLPPSPSLPPTALASLPLSPSLPLPHPGGRSSESGKSGDRSPLHLRSLPSTCDRSPIHLRSLPAPLHLRSWDLATLQYHCWGGRAGWEADSDYTVDRSRLAKGQVVPTWTSWTYRVAREVLPCFQGHPSQQE